MTSCLSTIEGIKMKNYIKQQIDWVKTFVSDTDSKGSNRRAISFIIVGVFCFSYIKVALFTHTIQDIPEFWALLIATLCGFSIWEKKVSK